jgi:catechol 2,3-dioxygenase-like lactoylglutathione lyase family enzyme
VICVAVRLPVSTALPVSDLDRARSFYVDTLGLTPILQAEDVLAYRCADGTNFGVFVSQGRASGTHTQVTFFSRHSAFQARSDDKPRAQPNCCMWKAQFCGAMVKTWPPGAMK